MASKQLRRVADVLKEVGLKEADDRLREADGRLREAENRLRDNDREIDRLKHFENRIHDSRPEQLKNCFDTNRNFWCEDHVARPPATIYIDDPIYRQLLIEKEIAQIFEHPILQRLAYVKQLSFSYLTFPAATHSRLSHSLGAARNVEHALTRIFQKGFIYTATGIKPINLDEDQKRRLILKAKVAALLHDLGHGPFGHGLDQYVTAITKEPSPDKFFAVNYVTNYLSETIAACGIDPGEILAILDSKSRSKLNGFDALIASLIDSPLDVDRMDYLVRDAHMTGLSIGTVNIDALIERIMPFEGEIEDGSVRNKQTVLTFDPSAIPYITHLLYARDSMYLNCYEHPSKLAAERMLTKAIDEFAQKNSVQIEDLVLLTDYELLKMLIDFSDPDDVSHHYAQALLRNLPFMEVFSICPRKYAAFLEKKAAKEKERANDAQKEESPHEDVEEDGGEEVPLKPAKIIEDWEDRSLIYKNRYLTIPATWEEKIADDANLGKDSWKLVVSVPSNRVEPKFDDIRILGETDVGYDYQKLEKKTGFWEGVLRHLAVERYIIRVFASSDLPTAKIEDIRRAAKELLTEE